MISNMPLSTLCDMLELQPYFQQLTSACIFRGIEIKNRNCVHLDLYSMNFSLELKVESLVAKL